MGEVFAGRYELVDLIGEGGMGSVWRVWDARERRHVAAKVLRQSDAVSLLRFVREQAVRVQHPHVLTPLGWAGEDDRVLFTMPVVDGGSVATLLGDHGPLPPLLVAELLRQLLDALGAVHGAGVLHRDLKPANLLLRTTGTARPHLFLTDFGIAIDLDGPRLTRTGQWSGTPGYLAPEVVTGAEPHPTSDLYAVGRLGLTMLTGVRPDGTSGRPDGVPDPLWALLSDLVEADPTARPASAAEARDRLLGDELAWRAGAMGEVEVLQQVPDLPDPTTRRRPYAAAVVVVAVAAVALVGLLLWSPWASDRDTDGVPPGRATTPVTSPPASSTSEPPTTEPLTAQPPTTEPPTGSTTSGGVRVGTVVVDVGQPCTFSEVGIRERTVDGVPVVCQRRDDGAYAWDEG